MTQQCKTPAQFERKFWNTKNYSIERLAYEAMAEMKATVCETLAMENPEMALFVDLNIPVPALSEIETTYRKNARKAAA